MVNGREDKSIILEVVGQFLPSSNSKTLMAIHIALAKQNKHATKNDLVPKGKKVTTTTTTSDTFV